MTVSYVFLLSPWHDAYADHHVEMPAEPGARPYSEPYATMKPNDELERRYSDRNYDRSSRWFSDSNSNGYGAPYGGRYSNPSFGRYNNAPSGGGYNASPSYGGYGAAPSGGGYNEASGGRQVR